MLSCTSCYRNNVSIISPYHVNVSNLGQYIDMLLPYVDAIDTLTEMFKKEKYLDTSSKHVHGMDMFEAAVKKDLKALGYGG